MRPAPPTAPVPGDASFTLDVWLRRDLAAGVRLGRPYMLLKTRAPRPPVGWPDDLPWPSVDDGLALPLEGWNFWRRRVAADWEEHGASEPLAKGGLRVRFRRRSQG